MPIPTPTTSLTPRVEPNWDALEARLGSAYDVKGARQAGLSAFEVEDEGRQMIADLHKKAGSIYDVQGAWDGSDLTYDEIIKEVQTATKEYTYGTISEQKPRGAIRRLWDSTKDAWKSTDPDVSAVELPQNRGVINKLAGAALAVPAGIVRGALKQLDVADEMGSDLAAGIAEKLPSVPVAIPALIGTGAAEAGNVLNWIGGPATKAFSGAKAAGALAKGGAFSKGVRLLDKLPLEFQYNPSNIADQAVGLAQLGRGAGGLLARGATGAARGVNSLGEFLNSGTKALEPSYVEDALATIGKKPADWRAYGRDTRINDLIEISGQEKIASAETALVQERAGRRRVELMKRNGLSTEQIDATLATEKAAKAAEPTVFQHPWQEAKETAARLSKDADASIREQGRGLQATIDAAETAKVDTATVDEVFGIGNQGPEQGLREESRTFKKYDEATEARGLLANGLKYFAGRFLADPSSVLPRLAHEAGRATDKFNRTKFAFYEGVREAFEGLDPTEKMITSIMLDTHKKDWKPFIKSITDNTMQAYTKARELLDKLADVEGLARQERVGDYFPHLDLRVDRGGKVAKVTSTGEDTTTVMASPAQSWLPRETEDTTGMIKDIIAKKTALGEVFDPEHLLAIRINSGLRKAYLNPMLKVWEPRVAAMTPGGKAYAEAYMNKLLGRPGKIWEGIDQALSKIPWGKGTLSARDLNRWQLGLTMNYYRGLLGLAFDTAFKNVGQVQNTIAEFGFRKTALGAGRLFSETFLTPEARKIFKNAGIIDDYEHIVAGSADMLNRGKFARAMDKVLFSPMKFSEYLNRGTAFHAGLAQAYEQGLKGNRALEFAKHGVDKTQFRYGTTNTSPYLQNPFGKLWYQFGSYPMKEVEFINEILRDPDKRKIYRMLLFHGAVLGTGGMTGSLALQDAMGYTPLAIPFTGDKDTGEGRMKIALPTGILPHLGIYSAPAMRTIASAGEAATELYNKGFPAAKAQALIDNMANILPGRRYLGKLAEIYNKLDSGMSTKPPRLQENVVSLMRGEGLKPYLPGGPKASSYEIQDALKELVGRAPKEEQEQIIPGILWREGQ